MQGRKRNRKLDFDYSSEAIYFVTICTQNRVHYFGKVESGKMNLSNFGKVAYEKCIWLENQYPYVEIHNFIIMPNHIHILFEINKINKERAKHYKYYTGRNWKDVSNYDMCLNVDELGIEHTAHVIIKMIKKDK